MSENAEPPPAVPDPASAPGGPRALALGCRCSVLANAAHRAGAPEDPCIDPTCPIHTAPAPAGAADGTPARS